MRGRLEVGTYLSSENSKNAPKSRPAMRKRDHTVIVGNFVKSFELEIFLHQTVLRRTSFVKNFVKNEVAKLTRHAPTRVS